MKVRVDPSLCQGHNRCHALAPDLFSLDEAGFASAVGDGTVPAGREDAAELAADNCPETAVLVDD
jgi:ferredoxin